MSPTALPPPALPLPAHVRRADRGLLALDKLPLVGAVLPGLMMPPGFSVARGLSIIPGVHAGNLSDSSSYTFPAVDLGPVVPGSYIALACTGRSASGQTFTGATLGGVAMTLVGSQSGGNTCAIFLGAAPATQTAQVIVTVSSALSCCWVQPFRITGPLNVAGSTFSGAAATNPSVSVNIPKGGVACAISGNLNTSAATATWTGLTEDLDTNLAEDGNNYRMVSAASGAFDAPQTNMLVQCTWTGQQSPVIGVAVFAPE